MSIKSGRVCSCVQALSRLNRSADKLGKKTKDLFVLDFFNSVEDIKNTFSIIEMKIWNKSYGICTKNINQNSLDKSYIRRQARKALFICFPLHNFC